MKPEVHRLNGRPVIIGAGLAGLMTALHLAPEPVLLLSAAPLGTQSSSGWAQGGLAASLGTDDSPELHLADTLAAGAGLGDPDIAERVTRAAPAAIEALMRHGAVFDRAPDGALRLGLEAAHQRRRIVHAAGDGTGRELIRALVEAVRRTPSAAILEGVTAQALLLADGEVAGVLARDGTGRAVVFETSRVVIATGGVGGLFPHSSNPLTSCGQGLALAARARAMLADMEFVQFHPTVLDGPARPMPLISEAVRGEGATLIDETGARFMADAPGAELAPRDVVARRVWAHLQAGHRVFLDARSALGPSFPRRFPTIAAACRAAGIDPATQPIPVRPAAHYHMGGIAVDGEGRSSVAGLWACGEAACTGLHGANRLASNSLTEAVVCAAWVAQSLSGALARPERRANALAVPSLPPADATPVRAILGDALGVLRDRVGLEAGVRQLLPLAAGSTAAADPAIVGLMLAVAALRREESVGAHYRTDFPQALTARRRSTLSLDEALGQARNIVARPIERQRERPLEAAPCPV
ncbi:L-aspartate oxidase [Bosea sp. 62]|uniref:L-aspartate oxidase n=1 Tax=unclassified Bosea (in: a-proteobacteria) TaxID=2653178 RepID=UPI001256BCE2|nr:MULTISPECIES: L-aspartate oxidase [unclassified Bosea (in: a-proteobacteria)]CAD5291930.1 L-aspartate oxidase [Bosea sp. 7B]CAD5299416.1 L-aspartate oxidase [Bosea sp. 21B]CAD5299567.1 L-aspartate oxidase [Bosea sp. 46]VVT61683.1 L-aspartate oxidase [Bosea sp. EC-HK365B]VXB05774.1 L-aspartate oxidase [Bosea sp. 127]